MKRYINFLFLILIAATVTQPYRAIESSDKSSNENVNFSLDAYIDSDKPLQLIDGNSTSKLSDSWVYNEVKTLHLDVDFTGADKTSKFIEISVPVGMKINSNPNEYINEITIGAVDTSKFAKEKISGTNSSLYTSNSGTIVFSVLENAETVSLDLLLSIDNKLWDTVQNSPANDLNKKSIEVVIGDNLNTVSKKLDTVYTIGRTWSSYVDSNISSYVQTDSEVILSSFLTMDYVQTTASRFYKTVTTKMDIPYTTKVENGVSIKKYADVKRVSVSYGGSYEIRDNQIFITYKNSWLSQIGFTVYLNFDSASFKANDSIKYQYGDLRVENNFTSDITQLLPLYTKTIGIASDKEVISVAASSINVFNNNNEQIVSHLGFFSLANNGELSSTKQITLNFPHGESTGVGVTTVRIPTNKAAQALSIDCVLWERGTNREYTGTIKINKGASSEFYMGYLLTASFAKNNLGLGNKELYFKEIKYVFGQVPFSYSSAARSSGHSTASSGNIWGVVFTNTPSGASYGNSIIIESLDSNGAVTGTLTKSLNSVITQTGQAPAYISSFNFYNSRNEIINEVQSGREFSIKGNINMSGYPYTNTGYMDKPIVLIKVPEGFTIDKSFTKFSSPTEPSKIIHYEITNANNPRRLANGEVVYEIAILNQGFGYYTENLGLASSINYEIRVDINKKVKTLALNGRGMIAIEDKNVKANAGGSYDRWYIPDTLDVNGNSTVTDKLATISSDMFLNVNATTGRLNTDFFVSVNNARFTRDPVFLLSPKDDLTFKFTVDNIHEGYTPKGMFDYTITIPKNTNPNFGFSLELSAFVEESPDFEILYSTNGTNYYTKDKISNLSEVKFIKFKSLIQINSDYNNEFLIKTKYTTDSYNKKCFFVSSMISGYQTYNERNSSNRIYQILDTIYTFIDDNSNKPVITSPIKNSLHELNSNINLTWAAKADKNTSRSTVDVQDSKKNKISTLDISGSSNNVKLSLPAADSYYITVTDYNLFGVPSTSLPLYIRYGVHEIQGSAITEDITTTNEIKYIAILADKDTPKGTEIMARIYYTLDKSGNIDLSDKPNQYMDVSIYNLTSINPIPVTLPPGTSKIKIKFILKNITTPIDLKATPALNQIKVLAK